MNELQFENASAEELIEMIKQNTQQLDVTVSDGKKNDGNHSIDHHQEQTSGKRPHPQEDAIDDSNENATKRRTLGHSMNTTDIQQPEQPPLEKTPNQSGPAGHEDSTSPQNPVPATSVVQGHNEDQNASSHNTDKKTETGEKLVNENEPSQNENPADIFSNIDASEQFQLLQQLEPDVLAGINLEELQKEIDKAEKYQQEQAKLNNRESSQHTEQQQENQSMDEGHSKMPTHGVSLSPSGPESGAQSPAATNKVPGNTQEQGRVRGSSVSQVRQVDSISTQPQVVTPVDHLGTFETNVPDCVLKMRKQSLPALDCVAAQILHILSSSNYKDVAPVVTHPDSEPFKALQAALFLFDQLKSLYTNESFLTSRVLMDASRPQSAPPTRSQRNTIQRVNLATFLAGVFGFIQVGFYHLNENFMDSFVAPTNRLLKSLMPLFLELKTHAFISGVRNEEQDIKSLLNELFPEDNERLLFGDRKGRAPFSSEMDFISQCKERRAALESADIDENSRKFSWLTFVKDMSEYIGKSMSSIIPPAPASTQPIVHNRSKPPLIVNARAPNGTHTSQQIKRPVVRTSKKSNEKTGPPLSVTLQAFNALKQKQRSHSVPQRAGWTVDEEKAFLDCMDKVGAPSWDRILKLYGKTGTVSTVLHNKTQAQMSERFEELKREFPEFGIPTPPMFSVTIQSKSQPPGATLSSSVASEQHEPKASSGEKTNPRSSESRVTAPKSVTQDNGSAKPNSTSEPGTTSTNRNEPGNAPSSFDESTASKPPKISASSPAVKPAAVAPTKSDGTSTTNT